MISPTVRTAQVGDFTYAAPKGMGGVKIPVVIESIEGDRVTAHEADPTTRKILTNGQSSPRSFWRVRADEIGILV